MTEGKTYLLYEGWSDPSVPPGMVVIPPEGWIPGEEARLVHVELVEMEDD